MHVVEDTRWTGSALLALWRECETNNALDQVTVIKHDGQIQMTSLRQQLASMSNMQGEGLASVRRDTAMYMSQLGELFHRHVCTSIPSLNGLSELLYYPFGGIDVVTAVGLTPSVRCVVFAGSEDFGGNAQTISNDFQQLQTLGSGYMRKGMGATLFDSHDDFESLHEELGLRGVGAMALLRLCGPLQADVECLSFFNLDQDGNLIFKQPHSLLQEPCSNVAVWVRTHACPDDIKLLLFIHHNTHVEDVAVDAFCRRLLPNVLLLKAAPDSLWMFPSQGLNSSESARSYKRCIRRSLLPAARTECITIADSCQADPAMPRPLFKHAPESVALRDVNPHGYESPYELFGYGERVFWSRGNNFQFNMEIGEIAGERDSQRIA